MKSPKQFAEGIYYNVPRDGAPEFVLGSLSIQKDRFSDWIYKQNVAEGEYIRLDILMGKEKPYICVNTYKKA